MEISCPLVTVEKDKEPLPLGALTLVSTWTGIQLDVLGDRSASPLTVQNILARAQPLASSTQDVL
jgi:hypothetical protein